MKKRIACIISGLLALIFLLTAFIYNNKVSDFNDIITIQPEEGSFSQNMLAEIKQEENNIDTFTGWTEKKNQIVTDDINNRNITTTVILLCGQSKLVLPWGKNLPAEDMDGCIIGEKLALMLFGGSDVEGQEVSYGNRLFTVRGVVKEPGNILIGQLNTDSVSENETQSENGIQSGVNQTTENACERINLLYTDKTKTSTRTASDFLNKNGINGQVLHYEHRKNLNYLVELIPGKWSDFSDWKQNIKELRQQEKISSQSEKSEIESLYLEWIRKRNVAAFCFVGSFATCLFTLKSKQLKTKYKYLTNFIR